MLNDSTSFIGLDLGDKRSHLATLDQGGELIEETRLPTTQLPSIGSSPPSLPVE